MVWAMLPLGDIWRCASELVAVVVLTNRHHLGMDKNEHSAMQSLRFISTIGAR
jgi:hypothetical protein